MDALILLGFVVLWIVLQVWVLPRLGVPTCLGGACRPPGLPWQDGPGSPADRSRPPAGSPTLPPADPDR